MAAAPENALCSAICKSNGHQCSFKARRMLNDQPVCMKHYKVVDACSICLENMCGVGTILLECGHVFHKACMIEWGQRNETCPLCRSPLTARTLMAINKQYIEFMSYMLFSLEPGARNEVFAHIDDVIAAAYVPMVFGGGAAARTQ